MRIEQQWQSLSLPRLENSQVYILAEATHRNSLLPKLEFHRPNYRPLWRIEELGELESYAPYLIESGSSPAFDDWLLSAKKVVPYTLLSTTLPVEQLARQLRFFTKLSGTDGKRYFLRIGASPMFHLYISSMAQEKATVEKLFANGQIQGYLFEDETTHLRQYCRAFFEKESQENPRYQREGYLKWLDLNAQA